MVDFPRSSAQLSSLDKLEITKQAERDLKKRKGGNNNPVKQSVSKKQKQETITVVSKRNLTVGMVVLGVVKQVSLIDCQVCLPNQLTGFLSATEISALVTQKILTQTEQEDDDDDEDFDLDLNNYVKVGDIYPFKIIAIDSKIELSLEGSRLNSSLTKDMLVPGLVNNTECKLILD
jgi:rRNA biogenesis protein RRP5